MSQSVNDPTIHSVFEPSTGTWQYVVADPSTRNAVIIDPVLDYDAASQTVSTITADGILTLVEEHKLCVTRILETHAHADHLTSAGYLQARLGEMQGRKPSIGIGKRITQVQELFGERYSVPQDEYEGVFDHLFEDDESFEIGSLQGVAMHLPGHTPDHLGYKIGDNVFCGDTLFHPDLGTARCDFPGGSAKDLYQAGRKLLSLPDHVKIWTGHDYVPSQREGPVASVSVEGHKRENKHLKNETSEEEFVAMRSQRDATLASPRLLHPALQVNIRAGRLPKDMTLRLPIKYHGKTAW